MSGRLLLDTNILIDDSRRRPEAVVFMRGLRARPVISAVTVAELYSGVREGNERVALDRFLAKTVVIDVGSQLAEQAGLYVREFGKSHGVGIADAVIAATTVAENAVLATLNTKHFPMLSATQLLKPY
jgi:predicted nucleic acid-binding protein